MNITNDVTRPNVSHLNMNKARKFLKKSKPSASAPAPAVNLKLSSKAQNITSKAVELYDAQTSVRADKVANALDIIKNWDGLDNEKVETIATKMLEGVE